MNSNNVIELQSVTDNAETDFLYKRDVRPLIGKSIKNIFLSILISLSFIAFASLSSGILSVSFNVDSLLKWASQHTIDALVIAFFVILMILRVVANIFRIVTIFNASKQSRKDLTTTKFIFTEDNFTVEIPNEITLKLNLNYQDILKYEIINNFITLELNVEGKGLRYKSLVMPIYSNAFSKISLNDFVQLLKIRQEQSKNKLREHQGIKERPIVQNS